MTAASDDLETRRGTELAQLSPILTQATPPVVDHASSSWIYAEDGGKYLDFTTGIGVTSTGHRHPRVVQAAREQVGRVIHAQYTTVMHRPLLELTERRGSILPEGLDSAFYATSGSEAAVPDILITAKAIASGFPISAITAPTALMSHAWPGSQDDTYGGNVVSAAAACATLGVIRDEIDLGLTALEASIRDAVR